MAALSKVRNGYNMTNAKRWLLPDGVEEILPREAHKLESLRRKLLDLYGSWGYELIS
jgi:ATP phosphoribosyltransferase regulatory subunit